MSPELPTPEHFSIDQLAEGVYAAIGFGHEAASSNAGIIDLGEHTLIFDTFNTPLAAAELRLVAGKLTGRPATFVVNSHCHADHWMGNQVFAGDAILISTHLTREFMPEATGWLQKFKSDPGLILKEIQSAKDRLAVETNPDKKQAIGKEIARYYLMQEHLPEQEFCPPVQTFEGHLEFHGTRHTVELNEYRGGHTRSDTCLFLPAEGILFTGDLCFFQTQPFMMGCDPEMWVSVLTALEHSPIQTFIPGHGPVGSKADITRQKEYLTLLPAFVTEKVARGMPLEDILSQTLPAPFDAWQVQGSNRFTTNVRYLYEQLGK